MNKRKVIYVLSDVDKALSFEWTAAGLRERFDLCFILIGKEKSGMSGFLTDHFIKYHEISDEKYRSSASKWLRLCLILIKERPNTVHTHLWKANLLGLSTAWLLGVKQRIYTRHHAMVHYDEYPRGLKWDRLCNRMATHVIAISKNVKEILINKDGANPAKVYLIHHGFDLSYFQGEHTIAIKALREKYQLNTKCYPVVGVIARYEKWKGVQCILPAFKELKEKHPQAHLVLVNAQGNYSRKIKGMLGELRNDSFTEILFESNLAPLYQLFDIFVHVPIDSESEAFGQIYVEALASGVPSIFTLSGVAPEFIVHEQNALVVPFLDSKSIYISLERIISDSALRSKLIANGKKSTDLFPFSKMISQLEQLYAS